MCGRPIGYVGRAIQFATGCKFVSKCSGTDLQKTLMSLPTTKWYLALGVLLIAIEVAAVVLT
jgi:hypothetical protein